MTKKKIVTIWGGNGQSNLLSAFYEFGDEEYEISSIVSMSDDGRTTGELMKKFQDELGLHLPPPWDLRRCLFMMSYSPMRDEFQQYMETVIERDLQISGLSAWDYFKLVWADDKFKEHLTEKDKDFLSYSLPLSSSIKWHKVGNILMANLYYNLGKDYNKMLSLMHRILEVRANIIPVTTKKATIKAILSNWQVIETQDRISDHAVYSSGIADLELMDDSKQAGGHEDVFHAIKQADYIIISPWDLFTSTISNFVIWGVREVIWSCKAKIVYIWNNTNKWGTIRWETQGLTCLDFINKIERFLWRKIDTYLCNNKRLKLNSHEKSRFQNDISVKWWDFLYLSEWEKSELMRRNVSFVESDLLDRKSFYKHDRCSVMKALRSIL